MHTTLVEYYELVVCICILEYEYELVGQIA